MIENGRGAGFPQFSGLSTPILNLFESFYVKNSVTVGFETVVTEKTICNNSLTFKTYTALDTAYAIVCVDDNYKYNFTTNGKESLIKPLNNGSYAIKLPKGNAEIIITKK